MVVTKGRGYTVGVELKAKVAEILQEFEDALARKIEPHEILTKIASNLRSDPSLTIPFIEGLIQIPTPQTAQLLEQMVGITQDKGTLKSIKRSLYKLRQKGVQWEEELRGEKSVLRPPQLGEPQGYLGAMDSTGSMIVIVARSRPLGGMRTYFTVVNDLEGIEHFERNDLTKKGFKEFVDRILRSSGEFSVVEAPGGYCLRFFIEAAERSRQLAKPLPRGFQDVQEDMQDVTWEGPVPLIYQYVPKETVEGRVRLLKESGTLHKVAPFTSWFLRPEEVQHYVKAIREAEESHLILTPQQRDARSNSLYMEALQGLFPEEKRRVWKRRLEEVAYILWRTGREQEARRAVSAALDLKTPFNPIEPNPFLWNLMLKSIYVQMEPSYKEHREEQRGSLIVTP